MTEVDAFDLASIEAFTSDLVAAGFEPEPDAARRIWRGPIHPSFAPLTSALHMRVCVRDGWPFVSPVLFVDGLNTNHLTERGFVCLWHTGDGSGAWVTVEGFFNRIGEWCAEAVNGWNVKGLAQDAWLNFTDKHPTVATFDLDQLEIGTPGGSGSFHAQVTFPWHIELKPGSALATDHLKGRWFQVGPREVPPRNLAETRQLLNRTQRRGLDRELANRRAATALTPSGAVDLILFCWNRGGSRHLLVLALEGAGEGMTAKALQHGPNDETSLLLRAGPDAVELRGRSSVVFGLGALGGHASLVLAESGLGHVRLVDGDDMLPGNVVRHVIGHQGVGIPKAAAVKIQINDHAPWTVVDPVFESPSSPARLAELVADVDLIVDTTGSEAATLALAATALVAGKPLVSGALYRGGAVARVQRQGTGNDVPIAARLDRPDYRRIPPGEDEVEMVEPAVGCSAPINNAPPTSVLACAALIAQVALDVLTARCEQPDEVTDVYRVLTGEKPFDALGRVEA